MKKTRKDFTKKVELPSGVEVAIENGKVIFNGKVEKAIPDCVTVKKEDNNLLVSVKKARKSEKREFGTIVAHLRNIVEGFQKEFEYELEMCNVHFPMTVTFDKAKSEFIIKNLVGEKHPRTLKVNKNIEVEIKAPHIKIKSHNIESAGQAAASLETITKIRNRDRNKFQDGIFITKKPGKSYL